LEWLQNLFYIEVIIFISWKYKLQRLSQYTTSIVIVLALVISLEFLLERLFSMQFDAGTQILFLALISFFSLLRAILSLNTDLTMASRVKYKLLFGFIFWSCLSFATGFYASFQAMEAVDDSIFPVVTFLAYIWKSYLLLFITCVNFIGAIFTFHKIANMVRIDTIEWFKRGFGQDGDPPKVCLTPIARKIVIGLISQLILNAAIFAFGSPESFFSAVTRLAQNALLFVGINL